MNLAFAQILEAILQASETPLPASELLEVLDKAAEFAAEDEVKLPLPEQLSEAFIEQSLEKLDAELQAQGRAVSVRKRPQGWKIVTRADYAPYIRGLFPDAQPTRLSGPALETLAIVAYRQPITKAEIEAVRGVSVDAMMQKLLDMGLVRIEGRADRPGRPLLFVTTTLFLEHFGLEEAQQLPNHEELSRLDLPQPEEKEPEIEQEKQLTFADAKSNAKPEPQEDGENSEENSEEKDLSEA